MNQLFQQLNPQSSGVRLNNPIVNLFNRVKLMTNPVQYINNSPELKSVRDMVNQNGGDARQVFYQLAQQKGIDPNQILDMFK